MAVVTTPNRKTVSMVEGCGYGKLLLFGEHAAVYGYPAVGISLPLSIEIGLKRASRPEQIGFTVRHLSARHTPPWDDLVALLPLRLSGELTIRSTVPVGCGLGSSAAFAVALAQIALLSSDRTGTGTPSATLSEAWLEKVWQLAHRLEHRFHGFPSGIDTGLATFGGMQAFFGSTTALPTATTSEFHPLPRRQPLDGEQRGLRIVYGVLSRHGTTASLVRRLRQQLQTGEPAAQRRVAILGETARDAIALLDQAHHRQPVGADGRVAQENYRLASHLGILANRAQEQLTALGLSTEQLRQTLAIGRKCGALGGKLSGAGGGGAFYLIFRGGDPRAVEAKQQLQQTLPAKERIAPATIIDL